MEKWKQEKLFLWHSSHCGRNHPIRNCVYSGSVKRNIDSEGSDFLNTAGILNHVVHTSNDLKDLRQWAGTNYTGESNYIAKQAVCNKNVITANGTAPLEFAKEILLA